MTGGTIARVGAAIGIAAGVAMAGLTPATAADLGGNCCTDLEERIAELEATTVRKGNRKVSLTVSGVVNEAIFGWDDGFERNAYVVTNEDVQDRFRFLGEAEIAKNWKAGYLLEIGVRGAREDRVTQDDPSGGTSANSLNVRHSAFWVSSKELGKVWIGQTSDAADGITEINLANTNHFASANKQYLGDGGSGFNIRLTDGTSLPGGNGVGLQWGDFAPLGLGQSVPGEGHRYNLVKYETPTIAGFVASAAWGEDDIGNLALRYKGEAAGFKIAGGIAYTESTDTSAAVARGAGNTNEFGLGASILHTDTGLYLTGAYGQLKDEGLEALYAGSAFNVDDKTTFYFLQGGIEKKFISVGKTTLFGEYWDLERGAGVSINSATGVASRLSAAPLNTGLANAVVESSEIQGWGLGANQNLGDFFDLYLLYNHVSLDATVANRLTGATAKAATEDFDYVVGGAQIKF
ncbi:MAG: hypothetical protein WC807_20615 [Hyphomicrobium sp.]